MPGERVAIAHELAQLSDRRWGDPTFGEATDAQHGGEVACIVLVVLDPAVAPVVPERMGEMDVGAELFEDVGGPIPAIGGLEDDLRFGPRSGHGLGELKRLTQDPFAAEDSPSSAIR